jgi:hypothetical protein
LSPPSLSTACFDRDLLLPADLTLAFPAAPQRILGIPLSSIAPLGRRASPPIKSILYSAR